MNTKTSKMQKRLATPKQKRTPVKGPVKKTVKKQEPNKIYDELNQTYEAINAGREEMAISVFAAIEHSRIVKDPNRSKLIRDHKKLTDVINALNKDFTAYKAAIDEIKKLHEGRTGGTITPNDHMQSLQIYSNYVEKQELYSKIIKDNAAVLQEEISYVLNKELLDLQEANSSQQESNPNVVTDVQPKENKDGTKA